MFWGHLPWKGKCCRHFLGIRSTTICKRQNRYSYKTRFQNFACTLWRSVLQHHDRVSKPKRRLSWKEAVQPLPCVDADTRGAGQGADGALPSTCEPAQAHGRDEQAASPLCGSLPGEGQTTALLHFLSITRPHYSTCEEVSILESGRLFFTDHHHDAGFFLSFFSVSLTVAASTRIKICGSQL